MARLKLTMEASPEWAMIGDLSKKFPTAEKEVMSYIGYSAAIDLYNNYFKGQVLNYRRDNGTTASGIPLDRRGRRMVSASVTRDGKTVYVKSFPNNLFEQGNRRSPTYDKYKGTITRRFKADVGNYIKTYAIRLLTKKGGWEELITKSKE